MKIDHVHFYVEDARAWRNWFVHKLGFQAHASVSSSGDTCTEIVKSGAIYFVLSSPLTPTSPVAEFLRQHPPGVADVAFCVEDIAAVMEQAQAHGAQIIQPLQHQQGCKWVKIAAWGSVSHTLIQRQDDKQGEMGSRGARQGGTFAGEINIYPLTPQRQLPQVGNERVDTERNSPLTPQRQLSQVGNERVDTERNSPLTFTGIDHIVLNVEKGDLDRAVAWYENVLGFHSRQSFKIQTDRSALSSQVMSHHNGVQFPINQPASPNSQIQEFLDANRGAGIQHIALQIPNIVQAIAHQRSCGVSFLPVPPTYYEKLQSRIELPLGAAQLEEIARQEILVDWQETNPQALLLQTFTQPIFTQPTFFFEIIERRFQAVGFGEGNFRALFEAIEGEQIKRGSI